MTYRKILIIILMATAHSAWADEIEPKWLSASAALAGKSDASFKTFSFALGYNHKMFGQDFLRYQIGLRYNQSDGKERFDFGRSNILVNKIYTNGVNVYAGVETIIIKKIFLGFNIDLMGHAINYTRPLLTQNSSISVLKPELFNILLVNQNDRGSLNSEFYIGYNYKEEFVICAGMSHFATGLYYKEFGVDKRAVSFSTMFLIKLQYNMWPGR